MPASDERLTQSEKFAELWAGSLARSYYLRNRKGADWKYERKDGPLRPEDFSGHFAGDAALGLVPINEENQCRWAGIDVDAETVDPAQLAQDCARRRMPVIVTRSKSGGAHVLIFFDHPQPAGFIRKKLQAYAAALGYSSAEIRPSKDKLGKNGYGKGLTLPYFNENRTASLEYALRPDGTAMPLSEFIETASRVRIADLARLDGADLKPAPTTRKDDLPPAPFSGQACSSKLVMAAKLTDQRNNFLFKKISELERMGYPPEIVEPLALQLNQVLFRNNPKGPLPEHEVKGTILRTAKRWREERDEIVPVRLMTVVEFLNRTAAADEDWLVEKFIPRRSHVLLHAKPKEGKSLTGQQVCFEAAAGLRVFGALHVPKPVRCAYVDLAQSYAETRRRHDQLERAFPDQAGHEANLFYFTKDDLRNFRALPWELADPTEPQALAFAESLAEWKVELLVIAEVRSFVRQGDNLKDQNISESINSWIEWLQQKTGTAVITIHHSRKGDGSQDVQESFGSTMLAAAPDAVISLRQLPTGLRRVHIESRFDAHEDFLLQLQNVNGGKALQIVQDPHEELDKKIMKLKEQGFSERAIATEVELSQASVSRRLQELGLKDRSGRKKNHKDPQELFEKEAVTRGDEM